MADPFFCFYSWQCRYALVRIHSTILDKDHLLCKLHNYRHRASLAYATTPSCISCLNTTLFSREILISC